MQEAKVGRVAARERHILAHVTLDGHLGDLPGRNALVRDAHDLVERALGLRAQLGGAEGAGLLARAFVAQVSERAAAVLALLGPVGGALAVGVVGREGREPCFFLIHLLFAYYLLIFFFYLYHVTRHTRHESLN